MMNHNAQNTAGNRRLTQYLSPVSVWALSFGCAVGWGAFVMPGTTFLPAAGPLGSALGIGLGALVMLIIGVNYHYLMNKYPDAGGTLTYASKVFGYDHGFLCSWFLVLVYAAIMWANASALPLIGRFLFGSLFQFGFHYQLLGYDVYFGEALLSIAAILLCGLICVYGKRIAVRLQVLFACILFGGVVFCAVAVMSKGGGTPPETLQTFADTGKSHFGQILNIIALSPWAFVGFESVSQSTEGFKFPVKWSLWIMAAALLTGAVTYILLCDLAVSRLPEGYGTWTEYIGDLGNLSGLDGLPTFHAVKSAMGRVGPLILGAAVFGGILTGIIGNATAASRLMYSMAEDEILPPWFGELNWVGTPKNALRFLMTVSLFIPFLGRTAIGWIVDVNTIGATIAYAYTSAAAFAVARRDRRRGVQAAGVVGIFMSAVFFFYFMSWKAGAMATESYLILATWSILGFVFFRYVFSRDHKHRFGQSTLVWICLLFLIFFTSLMWVKQATEDMTATVVENISEYYESRNPSDAATIADTEKYIAEQMALANRIQTRNSIIQMGLIVASLMIMFSVYNIMSAREKQSEADKARAEESSRAKTVFLSNMSHDIRTPMNAIIGYTNLAQREGNSPAEVRGYLTKIEASSQHLLALINDVLEMSRIESGKMDLEPVPVNLKKTFGEVRDMFATQMAEKDIDFVVDTSHVRQKHVLCDKNRLNRVLLNLLSNAYKFTPEGGNISVTVWEIGGGPEGWCRYEIRVKDSGIGMTPEFAARVFEAFERERNSTVSGIQGTGLGMAITKSIVDLMGGTIEVSTAPGLGTEFIVGLTLELQKEKTVEEEEETAQEEAMDFTGMRLLLVEDNEINREIATMLLEEAGFLLDTAENGQEAVEKVSASTPGEFDAVLMDIQMPVMNGYEAARAIRALANPALSRIPIIAMTANAFTEDIKAAEEAGMNGHIAKPIDVPRMMATLSEVLRKRER